MDRDMPPTTLAVPDDTPKTKATGGVDKQMVQYICTFFAIFLFAAVALANLSFQTGKNELWAALLYMLIGVLIPQPKYKARTPHGPPSTNPASAPLVSPLLDFDAVDGLRLRASQPPATSLPSTSDIKKET